MKKPKEVKRDDLRDANIRLAAENEESWGKIKKIKMWLATCTHEGKGSILIKDLEEML